MPTMPTAAVEASAMKAMVKAVMVKPMMVVKEPKPDADRYRNAVAIVVWVGVGVAVRGIILIIPGIILLAVFIVERIVAVDRGITLSLGWLCLPSAQRQSTRPPRQISGNRKRTWRVSIGTPIHKYTLPVHLPGSGTGILKKGFAVAGHPLLRRLVACRPKPAAADFASVSQLRLSALHASLFGPASLPLAVGRCGAEASRTLREAHYYCELQPDCHLTAVTPGSDPWPRVVTSIMLLPRFHVKTQVS